MPKWNDNRNKVKDIFDCIRNYALAGLVFYIGSYVIQIDSAFEILRYPFILLGVLTIFFALYLFWINHKLFNAIVREEHFAGNVGSIFYYVVPFCVSFLAVILLVQTAFSVKLESGKTIGETTINDLFQGGKGDSTNEP